MGQLTAWTFDTKRDWLIVVVLHARNPLLLAKMPQKLLVFRSLEHILANSHVCGIACSIASSPDKPQPVAHFPATF